MAITTLIEDNMPTYLYSCEEHAEFEAEHSITEQLDECPKCKEEGKKSVRPKRLISNTTFILSGGSWAREGYK